MLCLDIFFKVILSQMLQLIENLILSLINLDNIILKVIIEL